MIGRLILLLFAALSAGVQANVSGAQIASPLASPSYLAAPVRDPAIEQLVGDKNSQQRRQMRIIALAPHIVELLYSLGAGEQIIGTTEHADYPATANDIPRVGSYAGLQVEKIVQMRPDVILAWRTGNPEADLQRLRQYHLPVIYSEIEQLDDVARELQRYGQITGHIGTAAVLANSYRQRLSELRSHYQHQPPVSVFYELWSQPLTTVAHDAWPQQQLDLCGGHNPFANMTQDYPQVSLEKAILSDPELIIQPDNTTEGQARNAIQWSRWPHLRAVANQHIFHQNADTAHRMTLRALDAVDALCKAIDQVRKEQP